MRTLRSLIAVLFIALIAASCTVVVTPATNPEAPTVTVSSSGVASTVTLAAVTSGSFVYYTTDGTTPTISSNLYSSPFVVAGYGVTKTVKAIAYASGLYSSEVSKTVTVGSALSLSATSTTSDLINTNLNQPYGVVSNGTDLYVADTYYHRILVLSSGSVTVLAGSATSGSADGIGEAASFNKPMGLATDGTNLYVADYGNNEIRKIVIATKAVTTIAGSLAMGFTDGTGTSARFTFPVGLATDGNNLYIADYGNNAIRQMVLSTSVVTTLAGSTTAGSTDGTGGGASFNGPFFLTTDGANLYVSDFNNNSVRKVVISSGAVTKFLSITFPSGITTDGTNLYIVEYTNNEIAKYSISDKSGTTIATGLSSATGLAVDGTSLYVADTGNSKIKVIK